MKKDNFAERIKKLPPYPFIEIERKKKELIAKGVDIISFGVGDPDLPTPEHILKSCQEALTNPKYHQYPFGPGLIEFRQAISQWYRNRFGVLLDPETEIHSLIGSKEGLGHLPLAFVNYNDIVLVPDPGYPVYKAATILASGKVYAMPLREENDFFPTLSKIAPSILPKVKLMYLNYPNNPTTATATEDFFVEVVKFAKKHNIIVAHDAAYSEIYFSSPPISFLSIPGAKDIGVEFHSLSKTYNMTGWRIGWVCGNKEIIKGISTVKDNYDSGVFSAIQIAGVTALTSSQEYTDKIRQIYRQRRDIFCSGITKLGYQFKKPEATFYVWVKVPKGYSSTEWAEKLLTSAGILCTPGVSLGLCGEGYVRFALTVDIPQINSAIERMAKLA